VLVSVRSYSDDGRLFQALGSAQENERCDAEVTSFFVIFAILKISQDLTNLLLKFGSTLCDRV